MVNHYLTPGAIVDSSHTWDETQTFADSTALAFGTGSDSKIYYDGTDSFWNLRTVGTGDLMIALGSSFPSPDAGTIHIWNATAGVVAPDSNTLLTIENSTSAYLSFLVPANTRGGIKINTPSDNRAGMLEYVASATGSWQFHVDDTDRLHLLAAEMEFQQESTISTSAGALILDPTTAVVFSSVNAGVTANTNSAQGDNPITKMITQISVCANGGDAVTLPTAVAGAVIIVMNDGANAADVFPASSDNINEAGANTAYSLAVDKNAMFIAHDATHWSVILTA
jgi:hypothetical protein